MMRVSLIAAGLCLTACASSSDMRPATFSPNLAVTSACKGASCTPEPTTPVVDADVTAEFLRAEDALRSAVSSYRLKLARSDTLRDDIERDLQILGRTRDPRARAGRMEIIRGKRAELSELLEALSSDQSRLKAVEADYEAALRDYLNGLTDQDRQAEMERREREQEMLRLQREFPESARRFPPLFGRGGD